MGTDVQGKARQVSRVVAAARAWASARWTRDDGHVRVDVENRVIDGPRRQFAIVFPAFPTISTPRGRAPDRTASARCSSSVERKARAVADGSTSRR